MHSQYTETESDKEKVGQTDMKKVVEKTKYLLHYMKEYQGHSQETIIFVSNLQVI